MQRRTVVILANSVKKWPGRCIAGRELLIAGDDLTLGPWIRPVSADGEASEGALLPRHRSTVGDVPINVLGVFEIPLSHQRTDHGQPENWEVVSDMQWKPIGSLSQVGLLATIEDPPHLWDLGRVGTRKIAADSDLTVIGNSSLYLIRPSNFEYWVERVQYFGRSHPTITMMGRFEYKDRQYEFDITDDCFERQARANATATRKTYRPTFGDDCALCVSLTAPFKGNCYKLIAAVIPCAKRPA